MYKNNHVLGGVTWEVAHLCEFREILVVEQQSRRVAQGKVNRIRVGRPQQETPPNLPITAS